MKKSSYISKNVIRRLPRYLRKLDELGKAGVERISSGELGSQMGLTPSQIRQDFSCFGEFGQQGYGYNVAGLREQIAQSLIENFNFAHYGFRLLGAFEIRKELVGTQIAGVTIADAETQRDFIRDNNVDIAILSINRDHAQQVADELIDCGIKSIWNFTDADIDPGESGCIIENIHFSDSLLALSYYLTERE